MTTAWQLGVHECDILDAKAPRDAASTKSAS